MSYNDNEKVVKYVNIHLDDSYKVIRALVFLMYMFDVYNRRFIYSTLFYIILEIKRMVLFANQKNLIYQIKSEY